MFRNSKLLPAFPVPVGVIFRAADQPLVFDIKPRKHIQKEKVSGIDKHHFDISCPEEIFESADARKARTQSHIQKHQQIQQNEDDVQLYDLILSDIGLRCLLHTARKHRTVCLRKYKEKHAHHRIEYHAHDNSV